ncbi:MAG: sugar-binding transcriptional regulator [Firmicutes bacterium]|nr:sugar-binding transcriptional regulator [Bacillota bacterium]
MDRLGLIQKIAPEAGELLERRYVILRNMYFGGPVGRRSLAARLDWPERMVRKEIEFLRQQGLIEPDASGMRIAGGGESVLSELEACIREFRNLSSVEKLLAARLGLEEAVLVPGDSDSDPTVKKELARATASYLRGALKDGCVLAVTGGTTLAEVARSLPEEPLNIDLTVVPARGGLGEEVGVQANTIAAEIARRLGGSYRLLHAPDDLGEEAVSTLSEEPKIREILDLIRRADIVLHGIGTAEEMARRRGLPAGELDYLRAKRAVGEAFGYYFDREGRVVYSTRSFGLRIEDLAGVGKVVAVAGGSGKAEAALAVMSTRYQHVCITDEGAARLMLGPQFLAQGGVIGDDEDRDQRIRANRAKRVSRRAERP